LYICFNVFYSVVSLGSGELVIFFLYKCEEIVNYVILRRYIIFKLVVSYFEFSVQCDFIMQFISFKLYCYQILYSTVVQYSIASDISLSWQLGYIINEPINAIFIHFEHKDNFTYIDGHLPKWLKESKVKVFKEFFSNILKSIKFERLTIFMVKKVNKAEVEWCLLDSFVDLYTWIYIPHPEINVIKSCLVVDNTAV
jgi:hypothetical protein